MKTKEQMTFCPEKRRKFCVSAGYVYDILYEGKCILHQQQPLLSLFERWGRNRLLQKERFIRLVLLPRLPRSPETC